MPHSSLPTGTVTFLFTDIEGSTRLVQRWGDEYVGLVEAHDRLIHDSIESNSGTVVQTEGDAFFAVFVDAVNAVAAAHAAQMALLEHPWPLDGEVRVRMGLHTGSGIRGSSNYVGLDVHRAARISDAAHGGQTVMSETTALQVEPDLPARLGLRDLGKHRLKDLFEPEAIYQLVGGSLPGEFPPLRTLDAIPNNLPRQLTRFIGRVEELREVLGLLENTSILTLTGPGGTGKSRLALQVGAEAAIHFPDGVFFAALSPVSDGEVVPSTILNALGLQSSTKESPRTHLLNQVGGRHFLLILDNFEHLLEAAPLVADLVRASPRSKCLVTSRAPLRISGEQEFPVPPLHLAGEDHKEAADSLMEVEAVQLFADRAVAVRPDFEITDSNAALVSRLVSTLDGLPLAIELAASRLRLLPVETIVERLDAKMLSAGSVDLPERQRTINGTIDWSYQLLDGPQQRLLARLSVFAGGARLDEIESVCGIGGDGSAYLLDQLAMLVDHSLVGRTMGEGSPRFRLLHVIREYASDRLDELGETEEMNEQHLAAYADLVEAAEPELVGASRGHWLNMLEKDHDNIRAALKYALAHQPDTAQLLAGSLWRFWQSRGYLHEARRTVDAALAVDGGSPVSRARALEAQGGIMWWQGDLDGSLLAYEQALDLAREMGDRALLARALFNYANPVGFHLLDQEQGEALLAEADGIYHSLADESGLGDVEWGRGNNIAFTTQDYVAATEHMLASIDHYRKAGNEFGQAAALLRAGEMALRMDDEESAWPYLSDGLRLYASHRDLSSTLLFLSAMAKIALSLGDDPRAMRLAGAFHGLRLASGADLTVYSYWDMDELGYERLESLTGERAEAYREGLKMSFEEATIYALTGPGDS